MSKTFRSLQYPNFRLWIAGTTVASIGTWMQRIAQDWLVLQVLTDGRGLQMGIVTALQFVPLLFLAPLTGALADRVDRRRLLQVTQSMTGVFGLILGVLVITETAEIWMVYVLAFCGGVAQSFDTPARQAFVSELVPQAQLPNAVGLNSSSFNLARLVGPAVSGFLITWVGIGPIFILNAAFFAVPVVMMALMKKSDLITPKRAVEGKRSAREGLRYIGSRPDIILVLVVMGFVSAFGLNFQITSAMMATEVFGKAADGYGMLGSFMAIGSLSGSLLAARRAHPRLRMIVVAAFLFGVLEAALALAPGYWWFALISIPLGLVSLTLITSANASVQLSTPPELRGRVMAIYSMVFLGSTPIGAPIIGWVGETFGARWSLGVGAIACVIVAGIVGLWGMRHRDMLGHTGSDAS